jgi:signal transduction histidine kinase
LSGEVNSARCDKPGIFSSLWTFAGRRLVPQSLFGRIVLIIVLGIAGSQLLSVVVSVREYQRGGSEIFASVMIDRVVSYTSLFESLRPQDRAGIAMAISRPPFLVESVGERSEPLPLPADRESDAVQLRVELQRRLGGRFEVLVGGLSEPIATEMLARSDRHFFRRDRSVGRSLEGHTHEPAVGGRLGHDEGMLDEVARNIGRFLQFSPKTDSDSRMRQSMRTEAGSAPLLQVRLSDGSWLRFHSLAPSRVFSISPLLIFNWCLLLMAALLVSVVAAQMVIKPLRRLSEAADSFSRNLEAQPLHDSGPTEVRAAAQAFNRMHDRLATYLNSRKRMLMAMSHDLKTPLTRLRLRSELLEEGEVSERIKADLAEMEALVMSTLDYLRGSENSEAVAEVDARALVSAICEDHPVWMHKVSVEQGGPVVVRARPSLLRRALSNLIDNAIRYGESASVAFGNTPAGTIEMRISDRGPGIPEEHLQDVLKPFFRIDNSRNRATGGTGLGLAIAKEIIESAGGRVALYNRPDGLDAVVELPQSV